jgi:hypothetical protein
MRLLRSRRSSKGDVGPAPGGNELPEVFEALGHHGGTDGLGLCGEDDVSVDCIGRRRRMLAAPGQAVATQICKVAEPSYQYLHIATFLLDCRRYPSHNENVGLCSTVAHRMQGQRGGS